MLRTNPSQGMHGPGLTAISFFVKRISRELMSELFLKIQEPIKTTGKYSTGSLMFQYILINLERNQRTKCTLCPNIVQVSYELNLTEFESHSSPDCLRSPPPQYHSGLWTLAHALLFHDLYLAYLSLKLFSACTVSRKPSLLIASPMLGLVDFFSVCILSYLYVLQPDHKFQDGRNFIFFKSWGIKTLLFIFVIQVSGH